MRHTPVEGILATDAELDHTLGITLLREARSLRLYLMPAVRSILEQDSCILPVTRAFADLSIQDLTLDTPVPLCYRDGQASSISVEPFAVAADPPRFASTTAEGHTVGFVMVDQSTGGSCAFVPGCGALDQRLVRRLEAVDLVLFDGTFWSDDEMTRGGTGRRLGRQMGHVPISGPDGSEVRLSELPARHKLYTHINNTNPILDETSDERRHLSGLGIDIGRAGLRIEV
jgi:pyrroloquinoline quinone biosynthesis protein B